MYFFYLSTSSLQVKACSFGYDLIRGNSNEEGNIYIHLLPIQDGLSFRGCFCNCVFLNNINYYSTLYCV